jgi:glycosyltransferase involved in cell wall biosynthesis
MDSSRQHRNRILYVTYDGLTDPLGRSQILPYLTGLSGLGHEITVISCEKPALFDRDGRTIAAVCNRAGIEWRALRYHKRPPILSGAYDTWRLAREARRLHRRRGFDIVHCRSYLGSVAGLRLKLDFGVPFVFDMRGFWADECVERGSWPRSNPLYRAVYAYMKRLEARLLKHADHVISLTEAGVAPLHHMQVSAGARAPVTVIPCCADFEHFQLPGREARAAARLKLGISAEARVLLYLGAVGPWYMFEEMFDFFGAYLQRYPSAVLLFVTLQSPESVVSIGKGAGIDADRIVVRGATREEVPELMAAADAGLVFLRPLPSRAASSPAKMGEMIALGLPVISNAGVADVAAILAESGCGVGLLSFDAEAYAAAILELERSTMTAADIRASGRRWFDLAEGVRRYDDVYRGLSAGRRESGGSRAEAALVQSGAEWSAAVTGGAGQGS